MDTISKSMVNKTSVCRFCHKPTLESIYFREETVKGRPFHLAFRLCPTCPQFYDFIDWKTHRSMPYYNDISNLHIRLVKERDFKDKIFLMQKGHENICSKCGIRENKKLYLRSDRAFFDYVGYLCKKCETVYLVQRQNFRLKTREKNPGDMLDDGTYPKYHDIPFEEFVGSWATRSGIPEPESENVEIVLKIRKNQVKNIKKILIKHRIEAIYIYSKLPI